MSQSQNGSELGMVAVQMVQFRPIPPVNDHTSPFPEHPTAPKSIRKGTCCGGAFLEVEQLNSSCPKDSPDGPVNSGAWVSLLLLWDCA